MAQDRIRVRIDDETKAAAMARAAERGVTLSDVVRDLLALWCAGHIEIEGFKAIHLPTPAELAKLGKTLDRIKGAIDKGAGQLDYFAESYGRVLQMALDLEDDGWRELPAHLRRLLG